MGVLTSADFAVTMKEKRKAGCFVTIQVHDVFNNIAQGWLEQCDLDHGIAFVKVALSLDVCIVPLRNDMGTLPYSNLVAIQLTDSWASTPVRGVLTKDSSASEDGKLFCEFSKIVCPVRATLADDGMPLFDGDGNFVGMNLSSGGKCYYVEPNFIIEQLEQFEKRCKLRAQIRLEQSSKRRVSINPREVRRRDGKHYNSNPDAIELTCQDLSEEGLNSLGYRKRPETDVDGSMVLVNTFEEIFGDPYDSGIIIKWSGCTTILTSASLIRNPVDEKKIIENLRAGIGGPAVDLEGKFVGMNFYDWKDGTPFLPQFMIVQVLAHFEKERIVEEVDEYGNTNRWPVPKPLWCHPEHRHPHNEEKEEFEVPVPGTSYVERYGHFMGDLICLGRYRRRQSRPGP